MKYNPKINEEMAALPGFAGVHPLQPEDTVPQTLGPSSGRSYDQAEGVYISNPTSQSVDVAALAAAPVEITLPEEGPQILILHTHGTEAYTPAGEEDAYQPTDPYRTLDTGYNMVRVGDEIAAALEEALPYYPQRDRGLLRDRVEWCLKVQQRKLLS